MVVQQHLTPASGSFKLICCQAKCPNPPSTAPDPVEGYTLMLVHVETDAFDMNDLSQDPAYAQVVSSMLPLLPPVYATACTRSFMARSKQ